MELGGYNSEKLAKAWKMWYPHNFVYLASRHQCKQGWVKIWKCECHECSWMQDMLWILKKKEQTVWAGNLACDESREVLAELCNLRQGELTRISHRPLLCSSWPLCIVAFVATLGLFPRAHWAAALLCMKTFAGAIMTGGNNEQSSKQRVQGGCSCRQTHKSRRNKGVKSVLI